MAVAHGSIILLVEISKHSTTFILSPSSFTNGSHISLTFSSSFLRSKLSFKHPRIVHKVKSKPQDSSQVVLGSDSLTNFNHLLLPITQHSPYLSQGTRQMTTSKIKSGVHFRLQSTPKRRPVLKSRTSTKPSGMTDELQSNSKKSDSGGDLFEEIKGRFLSFKQNKYLENLEHFENLACGQAPKFMVIACADSRVCPSIVLGFQPGEAFVVRNVANLVPPYEGGPSETNAALEFAVNSIKVENILVVGHSRCGGINSLMSMHDDVDSSSFIGSWVSVGKIAKIRTKAASSTLSFDQQCKHCEKESVNCSLSNLLTYPWIKEKVVRGEVSIHGGYYDFVECAFEKWTLDFEGSKSGELAFKDGSFWS